MAYRETVKIRERKAAQREALVCAGESLVREHGFAGLTIQAVATRAGVGVGTLYRYFDDKGALCAEVFRYATEREVQAVADAMAVGGDVSGRLQNSVAVFAERALRAPQLAWSLIAEPAEPAVDTERLEYRKAYADLFGSLLAEGVRRGELPAQNCSLVAAALVGAMAEALLGPLAQRMMHSEVVEQLQALCLRAAGARAPQHMATATGVAS